MRKTTIGKDVSIGASCVISPGTVFENDSVLLDLSHVVSGVVHEGETWHGSPAVKKDTVSQIRLDPIRPSNFLTVIYTIGVILAVVFLEAWQTALETPFFTGIFLIAGEVSPLGLGWWWALILNVDKF